MPRQISKNSINRISDLRRTTAADAAAYIAKTLIRFPSTHRTPTFLAHGLVEKQKLQIIGSTLDFKIRVGGTTIFHSKATIPSQRRVPRSTSSSILVAGGCTTSVTNGRRGNERYRSRRACRNYILQLLLGQLQAIAVKGQIS